MVPKLVVVRLVTGEDVIGNITSTSEEEIELSKAHRLVLIPIDQQGTQYAVELVPFSLYAKTDVYSFAKHSVITVFEPNDQLRQRFFKQTSGLDIPGNSGSLITP